MSEHTIDVRHLTKTFGKFVAVDDVSFHVNKGEVYGWLGPNGAGKTTTIRMLLGLLKPSSGEARVLGYDPARQAKAMQAHVGYMSQLFTLYEDLTARENIRFYGRAYGLSRARLRDREAEIMEMAGLRGREDALTRNLSGGWKQRLALGCAIVHRPERGLPGRADGGCRPYQSSPILGSDLRHGQAGRHRLGHHALHG